MTSTHHICLVCFSLLYHPPDISIDTDDEKCPKCGTFLLDDEVVKGWIADAQSYTTSCPTCKKVFVPTFRVQSTSPSFVGSKGPGKRKILYHVTMCSFLSDV